MPHSADTTNGDDMPKSLWDELAEKTEECRKLRDGIKRGGFLVCEKCFLVMRRLPTWITRERPQLDNDLQCSDCSFKLGDPQ